ncbi:MAG TPA: hypothetical protein VHM90_06420, partial [Phycisphaerae bacterium]|nr:hypothetical protein [Phycisphaerae bacterium]
MNGMALPNPTSAGPQVPAEIDTLRAIVEGTATATGQAFFRELVKNLALAMDVRYAFVAEFLPPF